jgi:HlyD family secretion protein
VSKDHSGSILAESRPRPPGMRREAVFVIGIVAFLAVAVVIALVVLNRGKSGYLLGQWSEAVAASKDIVEVAQVTGTVEMSDSRILLAPEEGTLTSIAAQAGDWVARGALIAEISNADLPDTLAAAVSSLDSTKRSITRKQSDRVYARAKAKIDVKVMQDEVADDEAALKSATELEAVGSSSKKDIENAQRALDKAKADLDLLVLQDDNAEKTYQFDIADLQADKAKFEKEVKDYGDRLTALDVRSPIDGRILAWSSAVGDRVTKYGQIGTIADTKRPSVSFLIPETIAPRLTTGMAVDVGVGTGTYKGRLTTIGREATASDTYGTTVDAKAVFDAPPSDLSAGMTASGEISLGAKSGAIVLPRGPWLNSGGSRWVYVIKGKTAERVACTFGVSETDSIEVATGLSAGDKVITSDYSAFIDFDKISLGGKK